MRRIEFQPVASQHDAAVVLEDMAEVDVAVWAADGNPPMPFRHQALQRIFRHAFEIEVVPGLADIGLASAKRNEGDLGPVQKFETGILKARGREDDAIGKAAGDDAFQVVIRVLFRRAEQSNEIEFMAREHRLHAIKDAHEESVALAGNVVAGLYHETDDASCALAQGAPGLVCHIAKLFSRFQDAPARFLVYIGLAVQSAGHRSDRYIQMFGQLPDALHQPLRRKSAP